MRTRFWIAALLFPVVNAVVFGAGVITLLSVPTLADQASTLFPYVTGASLIISAPVAWLLAPRLRQRYWNRRQAM